MPLDFAAPGSSRTAHLTDSRGGHEMLLFLSHPEGKGKGVGAALWGPAN